ncbi:MAG: hypothetical protein ACRETQ_11530 [Gammaproteobacteria bacterium]
MVPLALKGADNLLVFSLSAMSSLTVTVRRNRSAGQVRDSVNCEDLRAGLHRLHRQAGCIPSAIQVVPLQRGSATRRFKFPRLVNLSTLLRLRFFTLFYVLLELLLHENLQLSRYVA